MFTFSVSDEYSCFPFVFPCPDVTSNTVIKCLTLLFTLFGMPAFIHSDRGPSLISHELHSYLTGKGVAMSHITPYNPAVNRQVEKYNGTAWKAVTMACRSKNLHIKYWQVVLLDVLHSLWSLLCTATNKTPHEHLFQFNCRSTSGNSVPSWLAMPGPVYLKRHVCYSKMEPLVDEVEIIGANPHYAHIRYLDGRQTTTSTKHLALFGEPTHYFQPSAPTLPGPLLEEEPNTHSMSTPDSTETDQVSALTSLPVPEIPL